MNKFNNSAALTSKWFDDTIHESFAGWQPSGRGNILDFEPLSSPILNNPTKEFNFAELGTEYAEKLYFDLVDTMRSAKGIGLSANQVGVPLSVFVAETGGEYPEGFFNPRIVSVAQELVTLEEGCLSFKTGFVVPIKRPKTCRIRYQLLTGAGSS
jgi:peptide deformylase